MGMVARVVESQVREEARMFPLTWRNYYRLCLAPPIALPGFASLVGSRMGEAWALFLVFPAGIWLFIAGIPYLGVAVWLWIRAGRASEGDFRKLGLLAPLILYPFVFVGHIAFLVVVGGAVVGGASDFLGLAREAHQVSIWSVGVLYSYVALVAFGRSLFYSPP